MKIEIRKPQYLAAKEPAGFVQEKNDGVKTPFFFRFLLVATYALSGMAIWYVFQRFSANS